MHSYLKKEADQLGLKIDLRGGTAERLAAEDNSMDAVVTLVLFVFCQTIVQKSYAFSNLVDAFIYRTRCCPTRTWLRRVQSGVKPI